MGCIQSIIPEHLKIHIISPYFRQYCNNNTCQCDIELDNSDDSENDDNKK